MVAVGAGAKTRMNGCIVLYCIVVGYRRGWWVMSDGLMGMCVWGCIECRNSFDGNGGEDVPRGVGVIYERTSSVGEEVGSVA